MSTSSSQPIPTASELAWLFGIREDDPHRYRVVSQSREAISKLDLELRLVCRQPSIIASFLSTYLPSLLNALGQLSSKSSLGELVVFILSHAKNERLPQWTRGLHRCPEASSLPTLLVQRLVAHPLSVLDNAPIKGEDNTNRSFDLARPLQRDVLLLLNTSAKATQFGTASTCDFDLHPRLLSELLRVGQHWLSTPSLQSTTEEEETQISHLNTGLCMVLRLFGLVDDQSSLYLEGREVILRCGRGEGKENVWCEVGGSGCEGCEAAGEEGMKSCSKADEPVLCSLVAYCSVAHQKFDWKKHKLVCFKPSWSNGFVGRGRRVEEVVEKKETSLEWISSGLD